MSTYELVKKAVQDQRSITFTYDGMERKMTPYVLGKKNGRQQVLCYQYEGDSDSGLSDIPAENWRCITLEGVSRLSINEEEFVKPFEHFKADKQTCVDEIDVEVEY